MTWNGINTTQSPRSPRVPGAGWRKGLPGRTVAILALLMSGIGTGAVAGTVQAAQAGPDPSALQSTLAAVGEPAQVEVAHLVVEESVPPAEQPAEAAPEAANAPAKPKTKAGSKAARPSNAAAPAVFEPVQAPAGGQAPVDCDRLDDKKIYWLRDLVAKTKAANPDQAATADWVDAQLRAQLGKDICAEEAQVYFTALCADASVKNFMHLMVDELPFFVRPLVGDPCTKDIVAAANKWLP